MHIWTPAVAAPSDIVPLAGQDSTHPASASIAASTPTTITFKPLQSLGDADIPLASTTPHPTPVPLAMPTHSASKSEIRREAGKIPLHIAVVQSILAAATEDRMRKICSNVVIVGGTGLIHNVGFAIESR